MRRCNGCTLCCTLLPVREISKLANTRCTHQRAHKGCAIYGTPAVPFACRLWTCRWLVNDDADNLRRPDRAGYVVDVAPDFIRLQQMDGSEKKIEVVQIWVDPKRRNSWRDPALLAWLEQRGHDGILGLVRFDSKEAIVLWPPSITGEIDWVTVSSGVREDEHTAADVADAMREMRA